MGYRKVFDNRHEVDELKVWNLVSEGHYVPCIPWWKNQLIVFLHCVLELCSIPAIWRGIMPGRLFFSFVTRFHDCFFNERNKMKINCLLHYDSLFSMQHILCDVKMWKSHYLWSFELFEFINLYFTFHLLLHEHSTSQNFKFKYQFWLVSMTPLMIKHTSLFIVMDSWRENSLRQ